MLPGADTEILSSQAHTAKRIGIQCKFQEILCKHLLVGYLTTRLRALSPKDVEHTFAQTVLLVPSTDSPLCVPYKYLGSFVWGLAGFEQALV